MALESLLGHYGEIPEFVDIQWVSRYIKFPSTWIRKVRLLDNLPYKISGNQNKLYRWTEVKKRLNKYKLMPPDVNHPYHKFTQPEVVALLNIYGSNYMNHVKKGHIPVHADDTGSKYVYNKDYNWFRRNFDIEYLVNQIDAPIRKETARIILGIGQIRLKRIIKDGTLTELPRKKRQRIKFSKENMLNIISKRTNMKYRRSEMPDVLSYEMAQIYSGLGKAFDGYLAIGALKPDMVPSPKGGLQRGFYKTTIDEFVLKMWCNQSYCENKSYYSRKAIRYKFGKCDLWIDTFIRGKCTPVHFGREVTKDGKPVFYRGWVKSEVEEIVNSGVEVEPDIFVPKRISYPIKAAIRDEKKLKPEFHQAPVDWIESAIDAAFSERDAKREAQVVELRKERAAKYARRAALQHELNYTTKASEPFTKNALLRLSNEREIVTIMYSRNGIRLYQKFKHSKYECIFKCSDTALFTRRPVPPSIGRIINNALTKIIAMELRRVPLWIVIVSGTSMVTDINFHEKLRNVPSNVGAVAAYGYEYRMPDGTWTTCNKTYGIYSRYDTKCPDTEYVIGTAGINGSHPVEIMDGPFVAIRGEYLQTFRQITFFNKLGDCRGAIGPILSAICKANGISMMQIPVDCWCSKEYEYNHDSLEWHKIEDAILDFEKKNGVVKY